MNESWACASGLVSLSTKTRESDCLNLGILLYNFSERIEGNASHEKKRMGYQKFLFLSLSECSTVEDHTLHLPVNHKINQTVMFHSWMCVCLTDSLLVLRKNPY